MDKILREMKYMKKDGKYYGCWGDFIFPDGHRVKLVENWFPLDEDTIDNMHS